MQEKASMCKVCGTRTYLGDFCCEYCRKKFSEESKICPRCGRTFYPRHSQQVVCSNVKCHYLKEV